MSPGLPSLGRLLLVLGLGLVGVGLLVMACSKLPWLGRLPGDIAIRRNGFSLYVPITTCLVISAAMSLVMWCLGRFRR